MFFAGNFAQLDKFLKDKFQFVPVLYIMILPKCSISDVWEGLFRVRCIEIIILFGCIDVEIIILLSQNYIEIIIFLE